MPATRATILARLSADPKPDPERDMLVLAARIPFFGRSEEERMARRVAVIAASLAVAGFAGSLALFATESHFLATTAPMTASLVLLGVASELRKVRRGMAGVIWRG
jgi:hypothetical protein